MREIVLSNATNNEIELHWCWLNELGDEKNRVERLLPRALNKRIAFGSEVEEMSFMATAHRCLESGELIKGSQKEEHMEKEQEKLEKEQEKQKEGIHSKQAADIKKQVENITQGAIVDFEVEMEKRQKGKNK